MTKNYLSTLTRQWSIISLGTPGARPAILCVLVAALGCQTIPTQDAAPPTLETYPCRFAIGAIVIDGKLDEPAWKKAEPLPIQYLLEPRDTTTLPKTHARLLWDEAFVYIAFDYADDDIWSYSNTPDDELWNGDVAELFIKPSTDKKLYYEFVIAPNATLFDARYPSRGAGGYMRFKPWSSGAKIASAIRGAGQGYTIEAAIPITAFPEWARPRKNATWTFAVFRYDYSKSYEDPLLMMSIPEAIGHGYHSYEYYQPLRFAK